MNKTFSLGRFVAVVCFFALLLGVSPSADAAAKGRRFYSPGGYSFEVPPGFKRVTKGVIGDKSAVWEAPGSRRIATSYVALPTDIPEKQLLELAKQTFRSVHGKNSKIVSARSVTVDGDVATVIGGEGWSNAKPSIKLGFVEVSILHRKKLYVLGTSVPIAQAKQGALLFSQALSTMKIDEKK